MCYQLWHATGYPGTVLISGELAGCWRARLCKDEITIFVRPSRALTAPERAAIRAQAAILAQLAEVPYAHVRYDKDEAQYRNGSQ
jgi:hypothetical protein